jgi:hypothetical protein
MQSYNNQLINCLEELKEQRDELNVQIQAEEEEQAAVQRLLCLLRDLPGSMTAY